MKKCVLCGSKDYQKLFKIDSFKYFKCRKCALVVRGGKSEVSYDDYHRDEDYEKFVGYFRNIYQKRFNIIKRFSSKGRSGPEDHRSLNEASGRNSKPGRVLDIGASAGAMLQIFQWNGWEAWGVEPSKVAKRAVSEIKMIRASIEGAKLPSNYFDVVILNHTLEHLQDPVSILKKVRRLLKRYGIVYIDVPNFASLDARVWPSHWQYLIPEEHLYQFTPKTLKAVFEKAGFAVVWARTWSGIFDVANPLFHFWYQLTSFKLHFLKSFVSDILGIPGNIIATALNRGTNLAMMGRKEK